MLPLLESHIFWKIEVTDESGEIMMLFDDIDESVHVVISSEVRYAVPAAKPESL